MSSPLKSAFIFRALLVGSLLSLLSACPASYPPSVASNPSPSVAVPIASSNDPLVGTWHIAQAKTTSGGDYTGTLTIEPLKQIYQLNWQTSIGNYPGLGFLYDDRLLVGSGTKPEAFGMAVYRITSENTLEGKWAQPSTNGKLGTETAIPDQPGHLTGTYQINGTSPVDNSRYRGTLKVEQTGDTYQLTWTIGNDSYSGVGLRSENWLVACWGQPGSFGVIEYQVKGDRLEGRWAVPDRPQLGVENLARQQEP